ncbi:MAG: ABC transporter ATP-binding protein [Gemmatimonadetes bacterium]|nr:ABC transporter ATP-binding protein [Gemmatimonadota bacterium]NNF39616.1 ABC transporter ATP-binding protein [Gemmatimonadota bacterium]
MITDTPTLTHVDVRSLTKTFRTDAGSFTALDDVDLSLTAGELVAVVGASGSGKSTLLHMLSGIDRPTRGEVHVGGTALHELDEDALSVWRGRGVGIVFQFFQLLPTLTSLENVMLPMDFAGTWPADEREPRAMGLLERMGVADQAGKLPSTLSGGQQQRVAIARALANDPPLVVADEPTGNLDSHTSAAVIDLFAELAADGRTVAIATHEREAALAADRTIVLRDGRIVRDEGASLG